MKARAAHGLAIAAALIVLAWCARSATALLAYPWDWSPDEGLLLDYARRLVEAPGTLYARALIPSPSFYTPLAPLLLAPIVAWSSHPLADARLLAMAWTAVAALAMFALVRPRAGPVLGLIAPALVLAPRDFSVWFVLVRFDGLMIALWLCAGALLIPSRIEAGADRLSGVRLWGGAALLLAAVLSKQTAVIHGAPLVLGWFLVDRRSAWRLSGVMLAGGVAAVVVLQLASDGGFLWIQRLWGIHPPYPGLFTWLVSQFVRAHALLLVLLAAALAVQWRRGERPFRDGAWLLVLGGLGVLPALSKAGAFTNYLLPLYCALVALACRIWPSSPPIAVLVPAALALALVSRPAPLPTPLDAATSAAFYSMVRERGRPLLATRPEYAYFLLRQPVEAEGSGLPYLVGARVAGTEELLARVRRREYRLIVAVPTFWPIDRVWVDGLQDNYEVAARCSLAYFYGRTEFFVFFPRGELARPVIPPGALCASVPPGNAAAAP